VPIFTAVIALPALFITPGARVASLGPFAITDTGARSALMLLLRVSTSVSFSILLILTTPWNRLLDALGSLRLPGIIVSLLSLSYRYLLLLLRTVCELFMARRSRVITALPFRQEAAFLSRSAGYLFLRSMHLAEGVHMAMVSRGWDDEAPKGSGWAGRALNGGGGTSGGSGKPGSRGGTGDPDTRGESARPAKPAPRGESAFELREISYTYPGDIRGIEIRRLEIPRGRCTMLLGPNGSGKSTLLAILDGLVYPQAGTVTAFGNALSEKALDEARFRKGFRSTVGLVFQDADIQCFSPTVREELAFGPRQQALADNEVSRRVEAALEALHISPLAERYPYNLSGGEKKRVALASILTLDLDAYLLDEPTANLDPATEGILIDILSELAAHGKTLVVATQDLMLARHIGDTAVILGSEKRPLFIGPVAEALTDTALLESAGLIHAHAHPHREAPAAFRHSHYMEDKNR
jgi:cobalt/nickel transport system ATP-binding protein